MEHLSKINFLYTGRTIPSQSERKRIYEQKEKEQQEQREQKLRELRLLGESHPEKILKETNYQ
ncbi:hypothetical protein [Dactylococcopsis salina]|uniref:Uncharacterized protein n=1 Tax=Dactylococcopsis salina (strain PCC 8305) TaxID=13035 RepID=K9YWL8_DACS8|nr:hypothetical protein [Dactylococcopsis salina]AFZ51316.1 hypothetical protein Dacsa_2741 [Dactylococcopsis salina PCC 8305]